MAQGWQPDINTRSFEAASGVTISRFALVGLDSSGNLVVGDSSSGEQAPAFGIALNSNSKLTTGVSVAKQAVLSNSSWTLTPGATIYLGTAGAPTTTAPTGTGTLVQVIGKAETATRGRFDVQDDYTENS